MYGPLYPPTTMQSAQHRLQMMEAQYPQYANPPVAYPGPNPSSPMVIKGRPVSNEEEANAAIIDYDGSLFVFPDKAHNKIYTKQLGMDGNINFCTYSLEPRRSSVKEDSPEPDLSIFPTREELKKELSGLHNYIGKLEQQIKNLKGGK